MQLSAHFSLEELIASETAVRSGIDNTPPEELLANLRVLAEGLEKVRAALGGRPIHVNSGYRCLTLNAAIGGAKSSLHLKGLAADIICPQYGPPLAVCRAMVSARVRTDQVIHEFGSWCHVAFAPPGVVPRAELFTIASATRGYERGLKPVA